MGVSDNYNVITSRQIGLIPNALGFLLTPLLQFHAFQGVISGDFLPGLV